MIKTIYSKNCPRCGNVMTYTNKRCHGISLKNNYNCKSCRTKEAKSIDKSEKYKRKCPTCNKDIFHISENQLQIAIKQNRLCRNCSQKTSQNKVRNFIRQCPTCNRDIKYLNKDTMDKAEQNKKKCMSCHTSGLNNPMYGVHRFGEDNPMYNKTCYDIWVKKYGLEEADKRLNAFKDKARIRATGKNNLNFNNKCGGSFHLIKYNKASKGKTYEQIHGEDISSAIKLKLSIATAGKNNPMYGKPIPKRSGNGWSGHYNGNYFRSILELKYLIYLIDNDIKFESGEAKEHSIKYMINEVERNYYPDYFLVDTDEYIEIKPIKLINSYQNKLKFEAARCKLDKRFKVLTQNDIIEVDLHVLYNKYVNKEIIFDKVYNDKFENYYNKHIGGIH